MPCNFVIAADGKFVVERWTGTVTLDELMAHKTRLANNSSIQEGASVLTDCTRAEFQVSPDAIFKLSAMDSGPQHNSRIKRYAFLVSKDIYDRAQQFADQVNRSGKSVIIFNSADVASRWLGLDPLRARELMESIRD